MRREEERKEEGKGEGWASDGDGGRRKGRGDRREGRKGRSDRDDVK